MSDPQWRREAVESPCTKLCVIHPEARICMGCYRTGDEIAGWLRMTPDERRAVMETLPERASRIPSGRRGGRNGRLRRTDSE